MESSRERARRLADHEAAAAVAESNAAERSRQAELQEAARLIAAERGDAPTAVIEAHRRALAAHRRATAIHEQAERLHLEAAMLQRELAAPD